MGKFRGNSHDLAFRASRLGGDTVSVCDYTGFMIHRGDQVMQEQFNGQGTYNTGFRVHRRVADDPNPQAQTPPVKSDPYPVLDVIRDTQGLDNPFEPVLVVDMTVGPHVFEEIPQVQEMVFRGGGGTVMFLPAFFQMRMTNGGGVAVGLGVLGNPGAVYTLASGRSALVTYNTWDWTETPLAV